MKKLSAIIATAILIVSLASCASSQEGDLTSINDYVAPDYTVKAENGTFTFSEGLGDTAIITDYSGVYTEHEVVIPETIEFQGGVRTVVGIGDEAFYYCTSVTGVKIPDTVTSIGKNAFTGCNKLASINIPDAVTSIGNAAFQGCEKLQTVNFGSESKLTALGNYVFAGCTSLSNITLPSKLESIGDAGFWGCESLAKVEMPESVKTIGKMAYYFCTGLNTQDCIVLTANIEEIGEFAFSSTRKEYISAPEGSYAKEYVDAMIDKEEQTTEEETAEITE